MCARTVACSDNCSHVRGPPQLDLFLNACQGHIGIKSGLKLVLDTTKKCHNLVRVVRREQAAIGKDKSANPRVAGIYRFDERGNGVREPIHHLGL